LAAVMAIVACGPAAAQAVQSVVAPQTGIGTLRVTIEDQLGAPHHEVAVTHVDETNGKTVATLTTASPTFEFSGVRPGPYGVRGTRPGFAFFYLSVDVSDLETTSRRVVMNVADAREVVTVIGRATPTERATRLDGVQPLQAPICGAGGCVVPAMKIADVRPAYPPAALTSGVEGSVIIQATIDEEGALREPTVLRHVDEALDAAALEAIAQWRFVPAQLNGVPVSVTANITVDFRLTAPAFAP
jgi:TonB family protein